MFKNKRLEVCAPKNAGDLLNKSSKLKMCILNWSVSFLERSIS